MLWRAIPSRFGVSLAFEPRKPMRSARAELRVMRTIFGLPAACIGTAFATMRTRKSAGTIRRHMPSSLPQRLKTHAGGSPAATQARLTSTIMEARITAYLALSTNPDPGSLTAGVRWGGPAAFLPAQKMARRSEAHHSGHRRHGPATAETIH